ncbi:Squamosa promoter binding protein-like protein [Melia azedarach]|uniref:Squamosa promoter binding protein-like protein n=1 Tax=Melia azedarach TaxID=155640 RepID=A0ACC1XSC4_MELAZ|nr:Squamosa promoter binding protein-like protein [Melia azedarach]
MDLKDANDYYRRHKLCVTHAMSPVIFVDNERRRFCQQCSKLHHPSLFDATRKSCRYSLASHNARRRKNAARDKEPAAAAAGQFLKQDHRNPSLSVESSPSLSNNILANAKLPLPPPPAISESSGSQQIFPEITRPFFLV